MFALPIRFFAPLALLSAALLTACGGGGGNDAPPAATLEVIKIGNGSGTVGGSGIDCGSTCTTTSTVGASVTLTATPGSGQMFDGWSGDAASCTTNTSCTLTLSSSRVVARASFSVIPTTTVSVALAGNSMGKVTSSPAGIDCGSDCSESYRQGGMITLIAAPQPNNTFAGWGGGAAGCGNGSSLSDGRSSCTLMLTGNSINAIATFQPVNRSLTVTKTGSGAVTSNPAGISCGSDCSNDYQKDSVITLSAAPEANFTFQGWGGACSGTANCTVTMDDNKTVTATFVSTNVRLTLTKTGNGSGTVSSNPAGISCGTTCMADFPRGSTVSLSAVAGSADTFQGWNGGGCSGIEGCTVTLSDNTTVMASFTTTTRLGEFFGLTSANRIVSFDRATPGTFKTSVLVTGLNTNETVVAIDTRPLDNKLYGLTNAGASNPARLVTIDAVTGAATLKSTLAADSNDPTSPYTAISGNPGMDFNPVADRLRIVTSTGQNLSVNADSGAVITEANVTTGSTVTDPAYTFNFSGSTGTTLFVIDSASDKLRVQTVNPGQVDDGTLTDVGALGADVAIDGGFEIIGTNIDAFAALKASADPATGAFYRIDLRTGALSKVGNFAGSDAIIDLTAPVSAAPPAVSDLALLTASGKLVTVDRSAPGTLRTSAFITGLTAGDMPLDIDYRPDAGRALYLLTKTSGSVGALYTVNVATGAVGNRIELSPDSGDTTSPYTGLTGNGIFNIDFNPAANLLRIIGSNGQNLRVNAGNGLTTTDTDIVTANTVVAAGYTNSFFQTASTTLFTIDANSRSLNRQDPPDDGTQTAVGSLALATVSGPIGFDISGRNNDGLLSMTDSSGKAMLYTVNLATGRASTGSEIAGGEAVKGLSLLPSAEPETFAIDATNRLLRFTTTTSTTYAVRGTVSLPGGARVLGMDFRPTTGDLVALGNDGKLYVIGTADAKVTPLSTLAPAPGDTYTTAAAAFPATGFFAINFDPVTDRLRVLGSNNINLSVDADSGSVRSDAILGRPRFDITGLAFDNETTPVLYGIDSTNNRLFSIDNDSTDVDAGLLTQIANLAVDVSAINGFDIVGSGTAAEALLATVDLTDNRVKLYTQALSGTGVSTLRGTVGVAAGVTLQGLSVSKQGGDVYAITNDGRMIAFLRGQPDALLVNRAITGINAETVIGIDFGGTNNTLYVVTKVNSGGAGKVYTLNLITGLATAVNVNGQITRDGGSYVPPGDSFGIDIDQSSNTLRITSDSDRKINVDVNLSTLVASASDTEFPLYQPTPVITADAYGFGRLGGDPAALFALDSSGNNLMRQGEASPNDGKLFDLRALGRNVTGTGDLEICGGADGYAVAVLQVQGLTARQDEAFSTLYRIDLNSAATAGLVTPALGTIGRMVQVPPSDTRVLVNVMATRLPPP